MSEDLPEGKHEPADPDQSAGGGADPTDDAPGGPAASGPALARAALDAARSRNPANRRRRATSGGQDGDADGVAGPARARGAEWSGPKADGRDPQPFGAVLSQLMRARGWERPAAEARLFGDWERVVGADVADHCRPVKLEDGVLTIEAKSTTWATQLRLLAASLLKKIAAEVGHNVVTRLNVHGPAAPSWNRGPRRIRGRGPRDTYG